MALTQVLVLQGVSPTTLEATDSLSFADGTFDNPITVDAYNDSTHIRSSVGVDDSAANTPVNNKYIAAGTADWGDGTEDIELATDAECALKISIGYDSNVTVTDITMFGYDGTTPATAQTEMTIQMAEQADTEWIAVGGSGTALSIADSDTPATSHDFYVLISAAPTTVGVKSANKMRFAFTYQ